jgi:hypothetical protein
MQTIFEYLQLDGLFQFIGEQCGLGIPENLDRQSAIRLEIGLAGTNVEPNRILDIFAGR